MGDRNVMEMVRPVGMEFRLRCGGIVTTANGQDGKVIAIYASGLTG